MLLHFQATYDLTVVPAIATEMRFDPNSTLQTMYGSGVQGLHPRTCQEAESRTDSSRGGGVQTLSVSHNLTGAGKDR